MLDNIDKKLLNLLHNNGRMSHSDLSRAVYISRPSVIKRIGRLLEEGIIEKFTAVLSLKKLGRPICCFMHISHIKLSVEQMLQQLDRREIVEIYSVTGENNFIAKAVVKDMECMEGLLEELMPYCRVVTSLIIAEYNTSNSPVE